jgi:hypothetical protein
MSLVHVECFIPINKEASAFPQWEWGDVEQGERDREIEES